MLTIWSGPKFCLMLMGYFVYQNTKPRQLNAQKQKSLAGHL